MTWRLLILTAVFSVLFSACDGRRDRRGPLYQRAVILRNEGRYEEATAILEEIVANNPKSFAAHQELAKIYHDNKGDFAMAIYHFRQCLRLAPDSEPVEAIEAWIKSAELSYYHKLNQEFSPGPDEFDGLGAELDSLREQNRKLRSMMVFLRSEMEKNRNPGEKSAPAADQIPEGDNVDLNLKYDEVIGAAGLEDANPSVAESDSSTPPDFYVVSPGDTLSGISQKVYGDGKYFKLIHDANRDIIPVSAQIHPGQRLKIPKIPNEAEAND